MSKSPRKPYVSSDEDSLDAPVNMRGDISYWKGTAIDIVRRFESIAFDFQHYRAEHRAKEESWECEKDGLWKIIVKERERRRTAIGFAVGAIVFALVALVMAFEIKRGIYAR